MFRSYIEFQLPNFADNSQLIQQNYVKSIEKPRLGGLTVANDRTGKGDETDLFICLCGELMSKIKAR